MSPAAPKPDPGPDDDEIRVLGSLVTILELLDDSARHRALVWAWDRYVDDRPPSTVHGGPYGDEEEP